MTEVLPEGEDGKPRTASLFSSMSLDTIALDDAVRLLTLPRVLEGTDDQEIFVSNGRYGPYVKRGSETRSLASEEQLLTLTVEQAEEILAQPKQRRGRGAPKPPLKDLGPDPQSGKPLVVKDGRFGPVRHGRRDEREPPPRRCAGQHHCRTRGRTARRKTR